jgi:RNA polymerase sigma-70 factor (ECF subfamily)
MRVSGCRDNTDQDMDNETVNWLKEHFLPFEGRLRMQLARVCQGPAEVDDVIQETYYRVLQAPTLAHVREPRAFLVQTAKNIVTDRLRRDAVVSIQAMASLEELGTEDGAPTPERIVAARAELDWVLRLAARLPERCRKVFRARRLQGLSQKETSETLGITLGMVDYETERAMELMSAMIAEHGAHDAPSRPTPRTAKRHAEH